MMVLVACEESGRVRDAFIRRGHDAMSCDLLETSSPGPHYCGDVHDIIGNGWDMMIAFPPCTHIAVSGAAWFADKRADGRQQEGVDFFMSLANAPIPHIAIENPVGIMSKAWRKPDQIVQPYYFGDEFQKTTCLWLKNLPKLTHAKSSDLFQEKTHVGRGEFVTFPSGKRMAKWYAHLRADKQRGHIRSKAVPGIAEAMASQWGKTIEP